MNMKKLFLLNLPYFLFVYIPRESGLTSSRSIFTREFTELLRGGIANEQETVCVC